MSGSDLETSYGGPEGSRVSFPVSKESLAVFIKDLLGGKREVCFKYDKPVVLDADLLNGIVSSIKSRVLAQNSAELISAELDINFSSGTSYRSIQVSDVFDIVPVGEDLTSYVKIRIVFLVLYSHSAAPSREVIEVSFSKINLGIGKLPSGKIVEFKGAIEVHIYSNERSWAEDMLVLSQRCLDRGAAAYNQIFPSRSIWFRKLSGFSFFTASTLIVVLYCGLVFWLANPMPVSNVDAAALDLVGLINLLNEIVRQTAPVRVLASVFAFFALGVAIFVSFFHFSEKITKVGALPDLVFKLFPPDDRALSRLQARLRKDKFGIAFAFILSIFSSIVASLIYDYLFS